ncbi:MAG: type II toxin-antitoxin system VapC family toxin [Acidimicrobiia bacterium]
MPSSDGAAALLDTHALVWWQAGSDRLSRRAAKAITNASRILVSPISFWELSMLAHKRRVALDRPVAAWVNDFLAGDRVAVAEFTPSIAVAAGSLEDFHGDPADRIIVATAIANGCVLLTKDDKIHAYATGSPAIATVW